MKQSSKNETDMSETINKIHAQLIMLDKKMDALIHRSQPEPKPTTPKPSNERMMHTAICADCKKECTIPFKPSGDRPVYCQDCFSRRKVIRLSGMTSQTPLIKEVAVSNQPVKTKKAVKAKKPVVKKKLAPKKK
jgi:CxxC-x17-CxxC domain-containing protein